MINRVSTASNFNNTIASYLNQQAEIAKVQKQISTGLKYDSFTDIAADGQTRHILDFSSLTTQIDTYKQGNAVITSRLNAMDVSIGQLEDINTKAISMMSLERSPSRSANALEPELRAVLQQVQDQLNANVDGRYLFSGADTNTPAVDQLDSQTSLDSNNNPTANYYRGDNADLVQNVSKSVTIRYNLKANNPAFQKLIGAMNLAIKAERDNSDAELASAIDLANQAQQLLADVRNQVGSNLTTIDRVNTEHDNFKTYLNQSLVTTISTDTAEASIQLSLDQAVLQGSFQAFAKVSNLRLSDYLK